MTVVTEMVLMTGPQDAAIAAARTERAKAAGEAEAGASMGGVTGTSSFTGNLLKSFIGRRVAQLAKGS